MERGELTTEGGAIDFARLDARVHDILAAGDVTPFQHHAAALLEVDPDRWPAAAVLAALVRHNADPVDRPVIDGLLARAEHRFLETGDARGRGLVAWARGAVHTGRGDVDDAAAAWREAAELAAPQTPTVAIALVQSVVTEFLAEGNVTRSLRMMSDAEHVAAASGSLRVQGNAATYLAMIAVHAGELRQADAAALRARAAFGQLRSDQVPGDRALADAVDGVVAASVRDTRRAEASFLRALVAIHPPTSPWYEAIVRSLRAEFLAYACPARAHDDARWAVQLSLARGEAFFLGWAVRARAAASLHSGEPEAAEALAASILETDLNPLERSRTLLLATRAALALGDRLSAEARAGEALDLARDVGATLTEIQALLLRAEVDPTRFADDVREARRLTRAEPSRADLWKDWPTLRVEQLGTQRVLLDGVPVAFRSEAAHQLVHSLVLAGAQGISVDDLRVRFWPGRTPSQTTSSLSTMLSQVRGALGQEAWRLERRAGFVRLDLDGVETDYRAARDAIVVSTTSAAARWALLAPLLPGWQREPWVRAADEERVRLVELLAREAGATRRR